MATYKISFDTGEQKLLQAGRVALRERFASFFAGDDGMAALVASYPSEGIVAIEREDAEIITRIVHPRSAEDEASHAAPAWASQRGEFDSGGDAA